MVNALLELADQLEGKPGFPIAKGEPELPDEDEYLVQKREFNILSLRFPLAETHPSL